MTQLLDRPIAAGSTLQPTPASSTGARAAVDFYLQGSQPTRQISIRVASAAGSLQRTWLASAMEEQVNHLLELPHGWDGGPSRPVSDDAVASAVAVLFAIAGDIPLAPQVFPLPDGGLQLEWHAGDSIEVEIDALGAAHVLAVTDTGLPILNSELDLTDEAQLGEVGDALERLSVRLARSR